MKYKFLLLQIFLVVLVVDVHSQVLNGSCGDNLTWEINPQTKVLKISGSGDMFSYKLGETPWYNYRTTIKAIEFPRGLKSIGTYAFYECSSLQSIVFPDSLISIRDYAFCFCSSIKTITMSDSLSSIGKEAFYSCDSLELLVLNEGLLSIGESCFQNCSNLRSVTIPESLSSLGRGAFWGVSSIEIVYWNAIDCYYSDKSSDYNSRGAFSNSRNDLNTHGKLIFGDNVITIPKDICKGINPDTVIIPNSVKYIGDGAFGRETNYIIMGNSVITIGEYAFENIQNTEIKIPNTTISIGNGAFAHTKLRVIDIGHSLMTLGNFVFTDYGYGDNQIERVICRAYTPPVIGTDCFKDIDKTITVYVPKESIELYQLYAGWSEFQYILPIEDLPSNSSNQQVDFNNEATQKYFERGGLSIKQGKNLFDISGRKIK